MRPRHKKPKLCPCLILLCIITVIIHGGPPGTLASSSGGAFLDLKSSTPTVLDAPIQFEANLRNAERRGPFVFRWGDNASPSHWKEITTRDKSSNLTLTYTSKEYEPAVYTMTVVCFAFVGEIFREEVASASTQFEITKELNGHITINNITFSAKAKPKPTVVSTANTTELSLALHDPTDYLSGAQLSYYWFINDTNFGLNTKPSFSYDFQHPGFSNVEVTVLAYFLNGSSSNAANAVAAADKVLRNRGHGGVAGGGDDGGGSIVSPPGVKFGIFRARLESRTPLQNISVSGNTWLKHGELLDLDVSCDGTGPWTYCWSIKASNYNITGNETCQDPEQLSTRCQFPIMWYFRQSGTFDILAQASNGLSVRRELIHINIYEIHSQVPIALVMVPIISALAAVVICACGISAFLHFKRNISVEIADFDFNPAEEDQMEPKTFWERVRDSMVNTLFQSSSDSVSHASSESSRGSGHHNSAGNIHYGSIP